MVGGWAALHSVRVAEGAPPLAFEVLLSGVVLSLAEEILTSNKGGKKQ